MTMSKILRCAAPDNGTSFTDSHDDFVNTPSEAVTALIHHPAFYLVVDDGATISEPCCGAGAISKVLEGAGYNVISENINDRGYGITGIDFLSTTKRRADVIVTNPPFNAPTGSAADFLRHAGQLEVPYLAMLLKTHFMQAGVRRGWIQEPRWRPSLKLELTWRLDWTGGGASPMDMAWFIWENPGKKIHRKTGQIDYLPKPQDDSLMARFKKPGMTGIIN